MGFFIVFLVIQSFGQNNSTFDYLPPHRRASRAVDTTQRAILAYPMPKTIKKNIETKFINLAGKEFSSTMGVFYLIFERKEISTRYFNGLRLPTPFFQGSIRPDLGYNFETNNAYGGIFYIGDFP
jgi:hypothetical protein